MNIRSIRNESQNDRWSSSEFTRRFRSQPIPTTPRLFATTSTAATTTVEISTINVRPKSPFGNSAALHEKLCSANRDAI